MPGSELVLYDTWSYCNYEGILAILWYGEHILTTTARYASCYNMWQIMLRSLVGRAGAHATTFASGWPGRVYAFKNCHLSISAEYCFEIPFDSRKIFGIFEFHIVATR